MSRNESNRIKPVEDVRVRIRENGEVLTLQYDGALTKHMGSLWWGTAVGYRAMQAVAEALSQDELWSRDNLYIVSAHPGGGVRDAINYVTRVVDRGRFNCVKDEEGAMQCGSLMSYEWWVSDGMRTASVRLRHDFVPWSFYNLVDRLGKPDTSEADKQAFEYFKVNLSARLWNAPLTESYQTEVVNQPLKAGDLPEAVKGGRYWDRVKEGKRLSAEALR